MDHCKNEPYLFDFGNNIFKQESCVYKLSRIIVQAIYIAFFHHSFNFWNDYFTKVADVQEPFQIVDSMRYICTQQELLQIIVEILL